MIRRPLALAAALALASPVVAQEDRDPGFLAGLIEDQLDAPGLEVQIDGFEGALSSRASVEVIRIADDEGVWLRLEDVSLDWNRSALLRGRLEVEELAAALIVLERPPLPAEGVEPPPAAAQGFSLPDLPVSIDVGSLSAERIELGEAVLGQAAALTLEASAQLADGSGAATLQARRLDGPEGVFALDASYDATTQALSIDLDAEEAEGGIVAGLAGIPGEPAVALSVEGDGPLDAFAATLALSTAGEPRLAGTVALEGTDAGRRFAVDLGGDVTALLAPDYRSFFGDDVSLVAEGLQADAGGFVLDRLDVEAQALTLSGRARIGADGWPELLDVEGTLAAPGGGPVTLPVGGDVTVGRADLRLDFDPAASDRWVLSLDVADLVTPAAEVATARVGAEGAITRTDGAVGAATGTIDGALTGLSFADPAVAEAVGDAVTLDGDVAWEAGQPLRVSDLSLEGAGYALTGVVAADRVTADDGETVTPVTLDLAASLGDLAALGALSGLDLAGAAEATVAGTVAPLEGTFDLDVGARTTALALGIAQVDPLLAGETSLSVEARRTDQGTFLDGLRFANDQLEATASFTIFGEETEARAEGRTGAAELDARIFDGALVDPRLAGPVRLVADVEQGEDGAWTGRLDGTAPEGVTLSAEGRLTGEGRDVQVSASVPDLSPFVEGVPGGVTLDGRISEAGGAWAVDAEVGGPWGLSARVDGPVTGDAPRVAFEADLPRAADAVPTLADLPPLAGAVTLSGVATQADGVWAVEAEARTEAGVVATVDGPVTGDAPRVAFTARVPELSDLSPATDGIDALAGAADLSGVATRPADAWQVAASLRTDAGLTADVDGTVTGDLDIAFDVAAPDLTAFSTAIEGIEPLATSAQLTGTLAQAGEALALAARVETATGIVAEVAGPITGETRPLAVTARLPDLAAFSATIEGIEPLAGAADLAGTVTLGAEAVAIDASLETEGGLVASVEGPVTGAAPRVAFEAAVPDARSLSDALEGVEPLQGLAVLDGVAAREGDVWSLDATLEAEGGLAASVSGPVTGDAARIAFSASIPDVAGLAPALTEVDALRGPATVEGVAAQEAGSWRVDVALTSEAGIVADVSGPVTGPEARVAFEARVPDLSAFSPALAEVEPLRGAADLTGTAAQQDGDWVLDVALSTDGGITADVEGAVTGPDARVRFDARVPDLAAFSTTLEGIEPLRGAATLDGEAAQEDGAWVLDVAVRTDGGIALDVAGPATGPDARIAFDARVPDVDAFAPALAEIEPLRGDVTAAGTLAQADGAWRLDARVDAPAGIVARAEGALTGPTGIALDVAATVPELERFAELVPAVPLEGALSLDATLRDTAGGLALDVRATGPFGARATAETVLSGPLSVDFTVAVPELSAIVPAVPGGLDLSGTARQAETGLVVDVTGMGPYGVMLDASVALPESGPVIAAEGSLPDPSQLAPQLQGAVDFTVAARQVEGDWSVDAEASGAGGLSLTARGIATGSDADLDVTVSAADVAPFAPGLSGALDADGRLFARDGGYAFEIEASGPLGATLSASGQLTGRAPEAAFDLQVPDLSPIAPDLRGPLRAEGTARQEEDGAFAVDVDLDGPGGTAASVTGTAGATSDLSITGTVPLGLANVALAPQRIDGTARFDFALNGAPALENLSGTISTTGAALALPTIGNGLGGIDATITLAGGRATVDLGARVESGGTLSVAGPISLAAPFDAGLDVRFDVIGEDPSLYTAEVAGRIAVTGPLAGGARIAGRIAIDGAEIRVPSSGITGVGDLPPVTHVATPAQVRRTLERAGQGLTPEDEDGAASDGGGNGGYALDVVVSAPSRIFVRGRGLDAELGGEIAVRGTTAAPVVVGGFELLRGRLDLLQQRFELDEGAITFQGSLVPFIRLVAVTQAETLTASIIVEGPATEPDVRFESSPAVPQEEILAQIFFGRDLSQLSALQAIQLANSVATLAGRGSGGLLDRLRGGTGLDDLDVTTDAEGNAAIRAGKYISDNIYTDVQVGQGGDARVTLNVDISPSLTARGATGATGDTSVGIFFERDY